MKKDDFLEILQATDYVHRSASPEEAACADYLYRRCCAYTDNVRIEPFAVKVTDQYEAELKLDGKTVECVPYMGFGDTELEAPLYFLSARDPYSLEQCRGKAVLTTGYPFNFEYEDIAKAGAACIICYTGENLAPDRPLDIRCLFYNTEGDCPAVPSLLIRSRDALAAIQSGVQTVSVRVKQTVREGESRNVIAEFPGLTEEYILCSAHYDTTPLSHGSYDNMTGCIALLNLMDALKDREPTRYGFRFVFTGSEETGSFGSKNYCRMHPEDLGKCVLNINVDMLGAIGEMEAVCSAEQKLADFISYWGLINGIGIRASLGAYSGDATIFADHGIPAVTFTRFTIYNTHISPFHTEGDTPEVIVADMLEKDVTVVRDFALLMANAAKMPVDRSIPDKVKTDIDIQEGRKRENG